jgi:hypothetical protein
VTSARRRRALPALTATALISRKGLARARARHARRHAAPWRPHVRSMGCCCDDGRCCVRRCRPRAPVTPRSSRPQPCSLRSDLRRPCFRSLPIRRRQQLRCPQSPRRGWRRTAARARLERRAALTRPWQPRHLRVVPCLGCRSLSCLRGRAAWALTPALEQRAQRASGRRAALQRRSPAQQRSGLLTGKARMRPLGRQARLCRRRAAPRHRLRPAICERRSHAGPTRRQAPAVLWPPASRPAWCSLALSRA